MEAYPSPEHHMPRGRLGWRQRVHVPDRFLQDVYLGARGKTYSENPHAVFPTRVRHSSRKGFGLRARLGL